MSVDRYEGKPLLRLLEFYVLRAIGELSQAEEEKLVQMAPKLTALYGGSGEWQEAIAASMKMPENMPGLITDMWEKSQEIASTRRETITPEQFAKMFVDQNFV